MKFYRTGNLLPLEVVENTTVAILGLGSLGSLVASLVAYPWKKIILIDPEKLENDNVERHLLGYSSVGRYKVDAMKDWLIDRGLDAKRIETVTDMSLELEALSHADILIVSIDDPKSCYEVNQVALNSNIPAIYGGIYPMGTGGQTVVIPTPGDFCYLCTEKMLGVFDYKGKDPNGDYGVDPMALVNSVGKLTAVPSLKYSIAAVASDMASSVMDILQGVAEPEILISAQTWEPIVNLRSSKDIASVTGLIMAMPELGLIPNMKLMQNDKKYQLGIKKSKMSLKIKRWDACPAHGSNISADEI